MVTITPIVQPSAGDRRSYDGAACTIRYIGAVQGTSGSWLGVEWDDPARGKHDGSHKGERYFTCLSKSPTAASFVRPTRTAESPRGFLEALVDKYTAKIADSAVIRFSGKVAEEVGFEKTRSKQANLGQLRVAILDGERINAAGDVVDGKGIGETCPKVQDLDLSRNLFGRLGPVVDVCAELPALRLLRLNGNRFEDVVNDESLQQDRCLTAFQGIEELALEDTLMTWDEICHLSSRCQKLSHLIASTNQLTNLLSPTARLGGFSSTLTALTMEFNEFTSISDIASLSELKFLRNIHLKGNNISSLLPLPPSPTRTTAPAPEDGEEEQRQQEEAEEERQPLAATPLPIFSSTVQYLDLSYNAISTWTFISNLPTCFPGLTALRIAHNPIYDNPDPTHSTSSTAAAATTKNQTEEAYMFTVARLPNLKQLNFGTISPDDRSDAEMFYLGRIAKHLAAIDLPATASEATIAEEEAKFAEREHPRYKELCELYGAPAVVRRKDVNPAFLEARLVTVHFTFVARGVRDREEKTVRIPRGLDVYAVKGLVAKLFAVERPLGLKLVWETGEWDPVAGFDEEVGDSDDEDDDDEDVERGTEKEKVAEGEMKNAVDIPASIGKKTGGKWIKREVELQDGPRQLGFCVDGQEVKIRVEMK